MILNLTQHVATPEQMADGVVEPKNKARVQELLTFTGKPTLREIHNSIMIQRTGEHPDSIGIR